MRLQHRLTAGAQLGDFHLKRRLGSGATGDVYLALDSRLDRDVALKVLHPHLCKDAAAVARFRREAQVVAGLSHPNVVPVYETGSQDGREWLVMHYVEGSSLEEILQQQGRLEVSTAVQLAVGCLRGLASAHKKGLVHRDLKPANILVRHDSQPLLTDFGMALLPGAAPLTEQDAVVGTAAYLSPEQCTLEDVDGRCDLYALGVIMYESLAGRLPFVADNAVGLIYQHVHEPAPDLRAEAPHIPAMLADIVRRLLEKDSGKRYSSAEDVLAALTFAQRSFDLAEDTTKKRTLTTPTGRGQPSGLSQRRWPMLGAAIGFALLATGVVALGLLLIGVSERGRLARPSAPAESAATEQRPVLGEQPLDAATLPVSTSVPDPPLPPPERFDNSIGMSFVRIPPGRFQMGSGEPQVDLQREFEGDAAQFEDEFPSHPVFILRAFHLGQFEVTQRQFKEIMGANPSGFTSDELLRVQQLKLKTDDFPVEHVNWYDAVEFCRRLSARQEEKKAGRVYRLPTEAEWEYACRAKTQSRHYFSADGQHLSEHAWSKDNSGGRTHAVGQLNPNEFKLYDALGNVAEWCHDTYDARYYIVSPDADPSGPEPAVSTRKVIRGGSYNYSPATGLFRCASRSHHPADGSRRYIGFRVVALLPEPSVERRP